MATTDIATCTEAKFTSWYAQYYDELLDDIITEDAIIQAVSNFRLSFILSE